MPEPEHERDADAPQGAPVAEQDRDAAEGEEAALGDDIEAGVEEEAPPDDPPISADTWDDEAEPPEPADESDPTPTTPQAEPVGDGDHVVEPGDCITSIARDTGHFWETIWNDPANADLKTVRKDPGVLLPGDQVFVPDMRLKEEPGETEKRHRFVRKGEPSFFRMVFKREDVPRAGEPYILEVAGKRIEGVLSAQGELASPIPGNAKTAKVTLNSGTDRECIYRVNLGHLDPHDVISGIQGRLNNLGFDAGPVDGVIGDQTQAALRRFQQQHGLPVTGEADAATQKALMKDHSS